MARAKTTQRAEARRRHRAQLAAESDQAVAVEGADVEPTEPSAGTPARSRPAAGGTPPARPRPSLFGAFRGAAKPANVREDIRALPDIALHTKAVWLPTLLLVVAGAALITPGLSGNAVVGFLGVALLYPPPMLPAFLAGMLTARGSWLVGGIAGLVSGIVMTIVIAIEPSVATTTTSAGSTVSGGLTTGTLTFLVFGGPIFGVGVGAFSGFYRRFLAASAPPRQSRRTQPPRKGATRGAGTRRR